MSEKKDTSQRLSFLSAVHEHAAYIRMVREQNLASRHQGQFIARAKQKPDGTGFGYPALDESVEKFVSRFNLD